MPNYSCHSIPIYWFIALFPHAYAVGLIKKSNNNQWNNHNPRSTTTSEVYKGSVPSDVYARFERAEACHKNAMENAPFFIGAVLAGNFAGLNNSVLNAAMGTYLGLRVVYSVLYVTTTTQKASYMRSLTWFVSVILLVGVYIRAGSVVSAQKQ